MAKDKKQHNKKAKKKAKKLKKQQKQAVILEAVPEAETPQEPVEGAGS